MQYLILTGMSGAGKTSASRYLEDMGVFCVDNLPPMMMIKFMEACQASAMKTDTAALAVDVRGEEFFDPKAVSTLIGETRRLGYRVTLIYLDAADDVLVSRYKETRRDHPLASGSVGLTEAIAREREMLEPLKETADFVIDTSAMRTKALQKRLRTILDVDSRAETFRIELMSFGFKRGIPRQGDLMLDVRFLPNPFYIEGLSHQTGLDPDVRSFVLNHPVTREFLAKTTDLLDFLLPHYREEGKHRLVITVGCTGGAHRSVAIAEALGAHLRENGYGADVSHRDLDLERAYWKNSGDDV